MIVYNSLEKLRFLKIKEMLETFPNHGHLASSPTQFVHSRKLLIAFHHQKLCKKYKLTINPQMFTRY
jgi:hypothetical protein